MRLRGVNAAVLFVRGEELAWCSFFFQDGLEGK